jgi:uncharacterized membrane protein
MHFRTSIAVRVRTRFRASLFLVAVLAALAAFAACSSGDKTLDAVDPQAVTADPTYDQVFAIVHNKCVSCHDSGAEEISALTTCTDIVALRGDILDRVQDNTMPPGVLPRLSSEDKLLIQRWVENGAPAPCN